MRWLLSILLAGVVHAAPMDAPTTAAAERLIAAAKVHPLATVLPSSDLAKGEAVIRTAMTNGLTAKQANEVRKALDTPEERAQVASVLSTLGSRADVVLVLIWLRNETQAQGPPPPATPSAYVWDVARMVLAGVDRDWLHLDPVEVCRAVAASGCTGVSIEMCADDDGAKVAPDVRREKYFALLREARARKLVLFVSVVNGWMSDAAINKHGQAFLGHVLAGGPEAVIAQAVGEIQTDTGRRFERDATAKLRAAGFKTCWNGSARPASKPAGYDYAAWHTCTTSGDSTAPRGMIEQTDCGSTIRWIGWVDAGKVEKLARSAKSRGAGVALYRYVGMSDFGPKTAPLWTEAWSRMAKVYGALSTPDAPIVNTGGPDALDVSGGTVQVASNNKMQPSEAMITKRMISARIAGGLVHWQYDSLGWSVKPGSKPTNGRCHIYWQEGGTIYGGHFDWLGVGQQAKTLGNVSNGYLTRRPPSGTTVYFCLISHDKRERTNLIAGGKWP